TQIDMLLKKTFRPEFLNRIDEIVMFNRLDKENIKKIVSIQLEKLGSRLVDRRIKLVFEDSAMNLIADAGYDPSFGARPFKRGIQTLLVNPLSMELLSGKIPDSSTIRVKGKPDNTLEFKVERN
ncbi:MAG: type VI secretion system ATPase TssH, partial [Treponema sp.]|nr:type VI secretion system ATPase TssH [Treponema sp.]